VDLINQVFEIEKKASSLTEPNSIHRNVRRMKEWFEREFVANNQGQSVIFSFTYHSPLGERYDETRTDCDASIAGTGTDNLIITEVIKPIVWYAIGNEPKRIAQQAIVVAESQSSEQIGTPTQQPEASSDVSTQLG
jgi:hypothetical protein